MAKRKTKKRSKKKGRKGKSSDTQSIVEIVSEKPFKISLPIFGKKRVINLSKQLHIDISDPGPALAEQAELSHFYRQALISAQASLKFLKSQMAELEGRMYIKFEEDLRTRNQRVTEGSIKTRIQQSKLWRTKNSELQTYEEVVDRLKAIVRSFDDRQNMLVSINVLTSAELKSRLASSLSTARRE